MTPRHISFQVTDYVHICGCGEKFICRIPTLLFVFNNIFRMRQVELALAEWEAEIATHELDEINAKVQEVLNNEH